MVRCIPGGLKTPESFTEVALDHESTAHEEFERAIHGCRSGSSTFVTDFPGNFLRREMAIGAEHDFRNRYTLCSDGQIMIAQECPKCLNHVRAGAMV